MLLLPRTTPSTRQPLPILPLQSLDGRRGVRGKRHRATPEKLDGRNGAKSEKRELDLGTIRTIDHRDRDRPLLGIGGLVLLLLGLCLPILSCILAYFFRLPLAFPHSGRLSQRCFQPVQESPRLREGFLLDQRQEDNPAKLERVPRLLRELGPCPLEQP